MNAVGLHDGDSREALSVIRDLFIDQQADLRGMQRIVGEHRTLLRSSFANRLLRGSFSDGEEALHVAEYVIPEHAQFTSGRVLLFHFSEPVKNETNETNLKLVGSIKVALREMLDRADGESALFLNEPFTSTGAAEAQTLLTDAFTRLTAKGASLTAVTHLYELYGPLSAQYGDRLISFTTESSADENGVHYAYRLERRAPDARRYARLIAESYGLSASRLLTDPGDIAQVEAFLRRGKEDAACL